MWLRVNNIHGKYEIAYHSYPEAKRAHQVLIQIVRAVKTTAHDHINNNVQGYFRIFKAQTSSKSG